MTYPQDEYDERAGIMQYDGGLSKEDAEERAHEILTKEYEEKEK